MKANLLIILILVVLAPAAASAGDWSGKGRAQIASPGQIVTEIGGLDVAGKIHLSAIVFRADGQSETVLRHVFGAGNTTDSTTVTMKLGDVAVFGATNGAQIELKITAITKTTVNLEMR